MGFEPKLGRLTFKEPQIIFTLSVAKPSYSLKDKAAAFLLA
jgi:hypothetical protein